MNTRSAPDSGGEISRHDVSFDGDSPQVPTRRSSRKCGSGGDGLEDSEVIQDTLTPKTRSAKNGAGDGSKDKSRRNGKDLSQPLSIDTDDFEDVGPPSKRLRATPRDDKKCTASPAPSSTPGASSCSPSVSKLTTTVRRERSHSAAIRQEEKPAEVFRKDLISAMKLADSEHLQPEHYLLLQDPWRQEWERGVQVPVGESIPQVSFRVIGENEITYGAYGFKLPVGKKYLHAVRDDNYKPALHELHESHKLAEDVCRYDMDDLDAVWLGKLNDEREAMGEAPVEEWMMEQVMGDLETQCYNNMQNAIKTVEGLGIEYDENVACDVCKSPEGEDENEMVFCDNCDICVHQACYGVPVIPEGSWMCRLCALGMCPKTTPCIFCPNTGGAMKSTKSGTKWAHVSCAWWIPEVSFGNPEKMEPISSISNIPASRWSLVCCICREKNGACIQCSVKQCKTAFHVTCAFSGGLDMRTVIDENNELLLLKGYCKKHSKKHEDGCSPKKGGNESSTPKKASEMTEEERTEVRSGKLATLAEEFYTRVTSQEVAANLKFDPDVVDVISAYWILKRKENFNAPLITPKMEEAELLEKQRQDSLLSRMKMFIHLRQDLERVRNLCYMVTKREKIRRQLARLKEDIFHQQLKCLSNREAQKSMSSEDCRAICNAHKLRNSVYDRYKFIRERAKKAEQGFYASLHDNSAEPVFKSKSKIKSEQRKLKAKQGQAKAKSVKDKAKLALAKAKQIQTKVKQQPPLIAKQEQDSKMKVKDTSLEKVGSRTKVQRVKVPEMESKLPNFKAGLIKGKDHIRNELETQVKDQNGMKDKEPVRLVPPKRKYSSLKALQMKGKEPNLKELARPTEPDTDLKVLSSRIVEEVLENKTPVTTGGSTLLPRRKIKLSEKAKSLALQNEIKAGKLIETNGLHVFNRNDLIVSDEIKERVQTRLEFAKRQRAATNGLCKHAQRQIPSYLMRKVSDQESLSGSPTKLYEVKSSYLQCSPVRPRGVQLVVQLDSETESNDSFYEKVDDEVSIRSSRESTPESGLFPARRLDFVRFTAKRRLSKRLKAARRPIMGTESGEEADSEWEEMTYVDDEDDRDFEPGSAVDFARRRSVVSSGSDVRRSSRVPRRSAVLLPMDEDSQSSIASKPSPRHASVVRPFTSYAS